VNSAARRPPVTEHERRTQRVRGGSTREPVDERHLVGIRRYVFERIPDRHRDPSRRGRHARHLAQRLHAVLEEHQAELTDDDFERPVGERQRLRRPLLPFDFGRETRRHGEHAVIGIHAGDAPSVGRSRTRFDREDTGAAGDVEHALARPDRRRIGDSRGPFSEESGNEERLVRVGGRDSRFERRVHGETGAYPAAFFSA
jgi:hypothetical protein